MARSRKLAVDTEPGVSAAREVSSVEPRIAGNTGPLADEVTALGDGSPLEPRRIEILPGHW
jgi:hypothetical protein